MLPQRATQLLFFLVVSLFLIAPSTLSAQLYNPVTHTNLACCPGDPLAVDVNGDGLADVIGSSGSDMEVWFSNGDGTFQAGSSYPSGGYLATSFASADLNGDSSLDLVVLNACISSADCSSSVLGVLLGNGDGTFGPVVTYNLGRPSYRAAVVDANGDGKQDLVFTSAHQVGTLLGNNDGTFQPIQTSDTGFSSTSISLTDVIGDGKVDLLAIDGVHAAVSLGNGDGTFRLAQVYDSGGVQPIAIAGTDVNNDGKKDILILNKCDAGGSCSSGELGVLLGNGDGTFQGAISSPTGGRFPSHMATTLQRNGSLFQLFVTECRHCWRGSGYPGSGRVAMFYGNSDGTLTLANLFYTGATGYSGAVTLGDVNGDGRLDILETWGIVGVLFHVGRYPTSSLLSSSPNPSVHGQSVTLTASVSSRLGIPTGFVRFMNGVHCLGKVTMVDGVAALTTDQLPVGSLPILAPYEPDVSWEKSQATLTQVVNPPSAKE